MKSFSSNKRIIKTTFWDKERYVFVSLLIGISISMGACKENPDNEAEITEALIQAVHRYDYIEDFHNGVALVKKYPNDNDWSDDGVVIHYGFIDVKGEEVVPCIYEHYCEEFEWRSN